MQALLERLKNEPVVVAGVVAAVLVAAAGQLNIILDEATIKEALVPLVTGLVARSFVVPARKAK